ncbi:hypothetical protein [uncultured Desulfovibrio sp.]|uniref:hypothetical protein n=1 Tax=uncultured Desulfovibrio sp. TaxID=167968 RepID=UPI0003A74DCA|nr:hypothetical protein [uncultured Desulfovibrio sp.]
MQERGWIEREKSDTVFTERDGGVLRRSGSLRMAGDTDRSLSTCGFGIQKHDGKDVFTNLEGGLKSAHCPTCGKDVERYFYDMGRRLVWGGRFSACKMSVVRCGVRYPEPQADTLWEFSRIGFEFWEMEPLRPEFVKEFTPMPGEPVGVVRAHI